MVRKLNRSIINLLFLGLCEISPLNTNETMPTIYIDENGCPSHVTAHNLMGDYYFYPTGNRTRIGSNFYFSEEVPKEKIVIETDDFSDVDYLELNLGYELQKITHGENGGIESFTMLNPRFDLGTVINGVRFSGNGSNKECYLVEYDNGINIREYKRD